MLFTLLRRPWYAFSVPAPESLPMWPKSRPTNNLNLPALTAEELVKALATHLNGIGGLVGDTDLEIARELVRRARRFEQVEAELAQATRKTG